MASKDPDQPTQPTLDEAVEVRGDRMLQGEGADSAPSSTGGAPVPPPPVAAPLRGMGWVARDGAERMGLRTPPEEDPEAEPEDTSAYGRPSPRGDDGKLIPPRLAGASGSPLDGAAAVPVLGVAMDLRPPQPPAPPEEAPPPGPGPIPRVTILSSPGKGQACPKCKGTLRVLRTTRENRLECTWFRLEWLEVERDWGDCPKHLEIETQPLARPAFALADGQLANGLLARLATWRWQDHMPGHDLTRVLASLGVRCGDADVARWLAQAGDIITPVAAAIRDRTQGGTTDALGILVMDEGRPGRLRATVKGDLVSFAWEPAEDQARPDDPSERARRVLLDARGWSRAGQQATLRRFVARALGTDRDQAAKASWRLEQLRAATDRAAEEQALAAVLPLLDLETVTDPHLKTAARSLAIGGAEALHRFTSSGKPAPPLELPENVRQTLPRWFLLLGDGSPHRVADWLTLTESCAAAGVPTWRHLRDIFEAFAEGGRQPLDGKAWVPQASKA